MHLARATLMAEKNRAYSSIILLGEGVRFLLDTIFFVSIKQIM